MDSPTCLLVHVLLSLLGIVSGLIVAGGLVSGTRMAGWTGFFLATTALTSLTGFGFPFTRVGPPPFGATHLAVLAVFAWLGWASLKGLKKA